METISGLDPEALNRARISRDPRFDGKFFIAVTSTGIYCRPICPSRYAKRANVRFFGSPAAAPFAASVSAIFLEASSIISSPSMTAPRRSSDVARSFTFH